MSADTDTPAEVASEHGVRITMPWAIGLLIVLAGVIAYLWVGVTYAISARYLTPGSDWLEQLLNWGIRVLAWPLMAAMHY